MNAKDPSKMSALLKLILILSVLCFIIGLGITFAVISAMPHKELDFSYPGSDLSRSVFEQQNNSYTFDPEYPDGYRTREGSYVIDTTKDEKAFVGETTFQKTDKKNIYRIFSSGSYDAVIDGFIRDVPALYCASPAADATKSTTYVSESGYYNGFACQYLAGSVTMKDLGGKSYVTYYTLYLAKVGEKDEYLLTGVCTSRASSATLATMRDMARDSLLRIHPYAEEEKNQ